MRSEELYDDLGFENWCDNDRKIEGILIWMLRMRRMNERIFS